MRTTFQPTPSDNPNIPLKDTTFRDNRGTFTAQMIIGPSWQRNTCDHRFEVFVGAEMNIWSNLQEIYRSSLAGAAEGKETFINTSWLALYGLTSRVTMDF